MKLSFFVLIFSFCIFAHAEPSSDCPERIDSIAYSVCKAKAAAKAKSDPSWGDCKEVARFCGRIADADPSVRDCVQSKGSAYKAAHGLPEDKVLPMDLIFTFLNQCSQLYHVDPNFLDVTSFVNSFN